jgi:thiol-disulfide isomerase/thioredoxin
MRSLVVVAATAAVIILFMTSSPTTGADNDLHAQMARLNERVVALEGELSALQTRINTNHPDAKAEQAAAEALLAVNMARKQGDMTTAKARVDALLKDYGNTRAAKQAAGLQRDLAVIGKPAPSTWTIERWFQGEGEINLDGSGTTLVVFWETWCPHCRREVPKLQKLYDEKRGNGLQVIGLSQLTKSANDESIRKFIDEHQLKFPLAKEDGKLADYFGVGGIPSAAVIKDKAVVWSGHPAQLTPAMIDGWL